MSSPGPALGFSASELIVTLSLVKTEYTWHSVVFALLHSNANDRKKSLSEKVQDVQSESPSFRDCVAYTETVQGSVDRVSSVAPSSTGSVPRRKTDTCILSPVQAPSPKRRMEAQGAVCLAIYHEQGKGPPIATARRDSKRSRNENQRSRSENSCKCGSVRIQCGQTESATHEATVDISRAKEMLNEERRVLDARVA